MTQNNCVGAFEKSSTNLVGAFPKRCFKKDLNDVLQFCRENNINIGYSLDSNSSSTFEHRYTMRRELTDGDQITYYLMDTEDDDKEMFSIALDLYDCTIEVLSTMINTIHLRKVVWVYKT